ncbi:uncharacterized protein BJ171DRAFT_625688 [Polychytrium aggregatum]|uniref:uncharacterized protein n=1 Tax=Polychytrium aggregatum TaxID=110093 RepID=UPI0022FF3A79|nr:uncharacterized protein BJ171DRAFT_625688 [Polychytrium aggregatum]KAI9187549.1 hypothetical protein BJ171DRAFT_625688 [Polychytrium aggregatum]
MSWKALSLVMSTLWSGGMAVIFSRPRTFLASIRRTRPSPNILSTPHQEPTMSTNATALTQLTTYGPQERALFQGQPKSGINISRVEFQEVTDFGKTTTAVVPWLGDQLEETWLYFTIEVNVGGFANAAGFGAIDSIEMWVGSMRLYQWTGMWLEAVSALEPTNYADELAAGRVPDGFTLYQPLCDFSLPQATTQSFLIRAPHAPFLFADVQAMQLKFRVIWATAASGVLGPAPTPHTSTDPPIPAQTAVFQDAAVFFKYRMWPTAPVNDPDVQKTQLLNTWVYYDVPVSPGSFKVVLPFRSVIHKLLWKFNPEATGLFTSVTLTLDGKPRFYQLPEIFPRIKTGYADFDCNVHYWDVGARRGGRGYKTRQDRAEQGGARLL